MTLTKQYATLNKQIVELEAKAQDIRKLIAEDILENRAGKSIKDDYGVFGFRKNILFVGSDNLLALEKKDKEQIKGIKDGIKVRRQRALTLGKAKEQELPSTLVIKLSNEYKIAK